MFAPLKRMHCVGLENRHYCYINRVSKTLVSDIHTRQVIYIQGKWHAFAYKARQWSNLAELNENELFSNSAGSFQYYVSVISLNKQLKTTFRILCFLCTSLMVYYVCCGTLWLKDVSLAGWAGSDEWVRQTRALIYLSFSPISHFIAADHIPHLI